MPPFGLRQLNILLGGVGESPKAAIVDFIGKRNAEDDEAHPPQHDKKEVRPQKQQVKTIWLEMRMAWNGRWGDFGVTLG